ncbi:MAG TPA: RluA family pseudouridine synthase [Myxococcota bacterium]|jgi:23S rRNA pseudouridine1911/1915/1917 synthase|nr:RluA family pseudouridine synthase [Myxococcota bacterium]
MTARDLSLRVPPDLAGQRLDVFLAGALGGGVSRSYAARLVAAGQVAVDGRPARKGEEVTSGMVVAVHGFVPPAERALAANPEIAVHVAFEDADVVVVDKPPRLPSHPNRWEEDRTLVSFLLARYPEMRDVGDDPLRPGIAHRLDTDTSGLLLAARNDPAWRAVRAQFDARTVEKEYLALVLGVPRDGAGEIVMPVGHHPGDPRRMVAVTGDRVRTRGEPRPATTRYEVLERFGGATPLALLRVQTLTGRMHQVRVHLDAIGHPLAGDTLYLGPRRRKRDTSGLDRHFLHAARLCFTHPTRATRLDLRAPLPPDLEAALARLRARAPSP